MLDGDWAFAVVSPGGPWKSVDRDDVRNSAGMMSEDTWRMRFFGEFGKLDLSKIVIRLSLPRHEPNEAMN